MGTARLPLAWHQHFHSCSGPRFSLKQRIAFTPPVCVFVHLGGKGAARHIPTLPARGVTTPGAQNELFLLLPVNSGEEPRVGFVLDGWFGDF